MQAIEEEKQEEEEGQGEQQPNPVSETIPKGEKNISLET